MNEALCVALMGYRGDYRPRKPVLFETCTVCRNIIVEGGYRGRTCSQRCKLSFRAKRRARTVAP